MLVVLVVEEVLSEIGIPLHEAGPTLFGRRIYTTLHSAGESVVMMSLDNNRQMVKEWLLREGFSDYVKLLCRDESDLAPAAWKIDTVHNLVAAGHHISYMIDNDPEVLGAVSRLGVPVLLALHAIDNPGRKNPRDVEDVTYRSWDTLVDTIETESLRRAEMRQKRREGLGTTLDE